MVVIFIPNSEKVTSRIDFIRRNADEMNLHLTFYAYMYLDPSLSEKIAPELSMCRVPFLQETKTDVKYTSIYNTMTLYGICFLKICRLQQHTVRRFESQMIDEVR